MVGRVVMRCLVVVGELSVWGACGDSALVCDLTMACFDLQ